ncbi:ATP-binding protein [Helicobacter sp. faydin-H20]|uniref:ATP-binding protein n=1 Tax=Helicobacter anatolicus TaxID=2905874 RepID=UPI001E3DF265|nr:ATP-binding protein [Helicobacter anatolicus]MCE3036470.1 ATP-binding protein [Helicobacter anatolicus]
MKKSLISAALCLSLASMTLSAKDFTGFSHPESVYGKKEVVFVSNVGEKLEPLAKDKDGFISKLDKEGNVIVKDFIKNLDAPKGMNSIGDTLYVVDIDKIKGFNMNDGQEVLNIDVKGAIFLNAIEVLDNKTLLVSDTGTGIIHKVDVVNKKYETFVKIDSKFGGPNGLLIDQKNNRVITVGYDPMGKEKGSIVAIDLKTKKISLLSKPLGALDGIVVAKNGDLLVSDWGENLKGVVYRIDLKGNITKLDLEAIGGPADMFSDGKNLWIPAMVDNKIIKIDLP